MALEVGISLLTLIPGQVGGSESYVRGLLGALDGDDGLTVLTNRHVTTPYRSRVPPNAKLHEVSSYRTGTTTPTRALAMLSARLAPRATAKDVPPNLDVVHYPLTVPIPSTKAKRVVTLHDVQHLELPQFFSREAATLGGIVSALVAIAGMLLGGFLGGKWGERYHRRADATILATREGGLRREPVTET